MKTTWKQIQKIAERNALFLDQQPDDFLDTDVPKTEKELILLLLLLLDDFEQDNGRLKKSRKNFFLVNSVDKIFRELATGAGFALLAKLVSRFQNVVANNNDYFKTMLGSSDQFRETTKIITDMVNTRLGMTADGVLKSDGYLYSLLNDNTVRNETRELFFKNVLSGSRVNDVRIDLTDFVIGGKDKKGIIYKFYSKFAYDTFGQIDRMASLQFSEKYNLRWFIYFGTIIRTSRAFCRKHINGLYNTEEAKNWIFENPGPVGVSDITYNPVIDMGGINCLHTAVFVTDEIKDDLIDRGYSTVPSNI